MKTLWSPWRMKFIKSMKKNNNCIFCQKIKDKNDKKNYVLYRGKYSFVILNIYPYATGHLMISPYKHIADFTKLTESELCEMFNLTKLCIKILKKIYNPDGFNVGFNLGKAAGAGIYQHIHMHIVPRWKGDINFITTISDTKVMPELLNITYTKLKKQIVI